jgi:monoamine oxidase
VVVTVVDVDVVVVGAGFAGLTAALRLRDAGRSVRVLEARDRVGGRTDTVSVGTTTLDLGGQWVGPGQDRLYALAGELGVETVAQLEQGDLVLLRGAAPERLSSIVDAFDDAAIGAYLTAIGELEALAEQVDVNEPWAAPRAEELDGTTMASWMRDHLPDAGGRDLLTLGIEAVFATEPANLSVLHLAFYCASAGGWARLTGTEGGAQQDRFVGGVGPMAEALASRLGDDVVLGAPVRRIDHDGDGVTVHHDLGSLRARRAVVALPPTLAGRVDYRPALPAWRDQLTQRLPAGSVIKFHVVYEAPWWRAEGLSGQVLVVGGRIDVTFDCSPGDGSAGVITGFFEGAQAMAAAELGEEGRRDHVVGVCAEALGEQARDWVYYVDRDWSAEEFTRGCYGAHLPPGAWTQLGPGLRRPVGALHWAGTETARRWMGYIEGAIESGQRAAAEADAALAR